MTRPTGINMKRTTPEFHATCARLAPTHTQPEIARITGYPRTTVAKSLQDQGIKSAGAPPTTYPEEKLTLARNLLEDGASYTEVAATVHMSHHTLTKMFPGHEWTPRQTALHLADRRKFNKIDTLYYNAKKARQS